MKNLKLILFSVSILFSLQIFSMEKSSQKDLNNNLFQAIRSENLEQIRSLIQKGADVNAKNNWGQTALMLAAPDQSKLVKLLIRSGADVNVKDKNDRTALIYAAQNYNSDALKYLALAGSDLNLIKDYKFAYQDLLEEIKKWIFKNYPNKKSKVLPKIKLLATQFSISLIINCNGNNLLHIAAMKEDAEMFGLIYSICPALISSTNNDDQTPVKLALGSIKVFNLIQKLTFTK